MRGTLRHDNDGLIISNTPGEGKKCSSSGPTRYRYDIRVNIGKHASKTQNQLNLVDAFTGNVFEQGISMESKGSVGALPTIIITFSRDLDAE
jgi:hypothetical protein